MLGGYHERAAAIADRLLPVPEGHAPNGSWEPASFHDRGVLKYWNNRLALYLAARLRSKAEGKPTYIGVPRNSEHIFRPGSAMVDVAAFIEAQNACRRDA